MVEDEALGPGEIAFMAPAVADGTATPDEARSLLKEFVRQANAGNVETRLIQHVRDCFATFLAGERKLLPAPEAGCREKSWVKVPTLDKAFGLTRASRGQPRVDFDTQCTVAMEVLERRLIGETLEQASEAVAADRKAKGLPLSSDTQVSDSWARYKRDGLVWLRVFRTREVDPDDGGWTKDEMKRLCEIYADVPGIVLPGEEMFEGRHAIPDSDAPSNSGNTPP